MKSVGFIGLGNVGAQVGRHIIAKQGGSDHS